MQYTNPRFEQVNGQELLAIDGPRGVRYLSPRVVVVRMSDLRVVVAYEGGLRSLDEGEALMVPLLDLPPGAMVQVGGPL